MSPELLPPPYQPRDTRYRNEGSDTNRLRSSSCQNTQATGHGVLRHADYSMKDKIRLDFTQRIERKLAEYNASNNVFKRWLFEIICWLISATSMGAIIAIYLRLNNRPMAQAGMFLTCTNVLGKIASAGLIVPTSEALGQLKWNWFSKSRAMWDFEIFDKASRGPLGAILLLFRTKGRSLAALGAILIVLLLAIDTFFQQVVDLPDRATLQATSGTLPRVIEYAPPYTPSYFLGYESVAEDRALAAVAREFLYGNGTQAVPFGNGTRPDIPLTCPTGNCVWPTYETLAVCSSCSDVSDLVGYEYACLNTTIDWSVAWEGPLSEKPYPNGTVCGYFLNATSSTPLLLSGYVLPENGSMTTGEALLVRAVPLSDFDTKAPYYADGSIGYKDVRTPILDVLISSAKSGSKSVYRKEPPLVQECILTWCVLTMRSSYTGGLYEEEVHTTYLEPKGEKDPWPWDALATDAGSNLIYTQNITLEPPRLDTPTTVVANDTYKLDNITQANALFFFDDFFPSFYTAANLSAVPRLRYKVYRDGSYIRKLKFNPWEYPNNVTRHMERLAKAMTNVVRSSDSRTMLDGQAYQREPYISIQWQWLTFPLALLVLSLVFLVCTIIKTSSPGAAAIWKTSAMPALIYSLPKETQGQLDNWGKGTGAPRKTRIKLLPNMGWRVSGHSYTSRSPRLASGERVPRGWI